MPRLSQILALLCTLLTFAAVAHAKDDGHDKDRAFFTKAYADVDKATSNKDVDGATAYLADDFADVNQQGVEDAHSKAEAAETTRKVFAKPGTITAATFVTNITFTAEGATVMEAATNTFTVTVNGKTVVGVDKTASRDLWVKSSQGWLEKRSTILTDSYTVDRKPAS